MARDAIPSIPMPLQNKELSFEDAKSEGRDGVIAYAGRRPICWRPTREEAEGEAKYYLRTGRFTSIPEVEVEPRTGTMMF